MKDLFKFIKSNYIIISTEDEFLNEYSSSKKMELLTGFTGSTGFAIMAKSGMNILFVDSRYTLQAKSEASSEDFQILPLENLKAYLSENFTEKSIAIDAISTSFKFFNELTKAGILLEVFSSQVTQKASTVFDFKLAGETKEDKIAKILKYLESEKADALFLFNPQDVCWLFNIRGNFLPNTPLVNSFAIVSRETQKLISFEELTNIKFNKLLVPNFISLHCYNVLKQNNLEVAFEKSDFILNAKAIKTATEIECIKKAHAEDSKALQEFEKWLKKANLENETEFTIGEKLLEFRKQQKGFKEESFPAIVGFKENGAVVHYRATKEKAKKIEGSGLLLVDSGGQYYDENNAICGTTDVTRVFAIGKMPTDEEKRVYTLVLKGHIALSLAVFPESTTGAEIDFLARQFLYNHGFNYGHGTGHGVGYFLSVHEGPAGISKNYKVPLKAGMVLSNEPGCYLEGKFGVRFESLILVKKHSELKGFLCFETLTKAPIEKLLLDYEILTDIEIEWLKQYHESL